MGLVDSIIGVESGGNPNATNPNSSASGLVGSNAAALPSVDVGHEFGARSLIGKLFFPGSPTAVLRGIVSVVVLPIKRVRLARARPHVGEEILKTGPALANLNASTAVVFVRSVLRQFAAALHAIPNLVLGRRLASSTYRGRPAVRGVRLLGRFDLVAAAANSVAGLKVGDGHDSLGAAIATAKHSSHFCASIFSNLWLGFRVNSKFSESHSNVILAGH